MSTPDGGQLSARGQARRREILGLAESALTSRRRRRTAVRAGGLATIPLAALLLALLSPGLSRLAPAPRPALIANAVAPRPAPLARLVLTNPSLLERARVATQPVPKSAVIDDEELHDLLVESGHDGGLIRVGGRVLVASELSAEAPQDRDPSHTPG